MVTVRSTALTLCLLALTGWCYMSHAAQSSVVTEESLIESADPGIRLFVRNKRPAAMTQYRSDKTVLYVHGATQAASSTFDLEIDRESWMDYIARHGYDVYLVDLRGYGRSTRPPEFARPAEDNSPVVRSDVAMRDVAATIDYILQHRHLSGLNLIGWSWGTVLVGRYASEHKDTVQKLVLYAPVWLHEPTGPAPALGAYRTWTMADARKILQTGAPEPRRADLLSLEVFAAWSAAETATDPEGARQSPPVVRTPNGIYADDRDFWTAGKAPWEPSEITVPTLVAVGDWDGITPPARARAVFDKLVNAPQRRLVQIGEATHIVLLERNRLQLYREVQLFLDE